MIDSNELLAIGAALVETVKFYIPYAVNMDNKGQLFYEYKNTDFYKKLHNDMVDSRKDPTKLNGYIEKAQAALSMGTANCGRLIATAMYISNLIKTNYHEAIYVTKIMIEQKDNNHAIIILHQSYSFFNLKEGSLPSLSNLESLYAKYENDLRNAIVVDPWIHTAVKLSEVNKLLESAKDYKVEDFYAGVININQKTKVSTLSQDVNYIEKYSYLVNKFEEFYQKQKEKLENGRSSFAQGRRFSSVKNSLILDVNREHENKIITIQRMYRGYATRKSLDQSQFYANHKFLNDRGQGSFLYEEEKKSGSSRSSYSSRLSNQSVKHRLAKDWKLKVAKMCKLKILEILKTYSKFNPNNASKFSKVAEYFKGRHHTGRLEMVFRAIDMADNVDNMLEILNKEKKAFEAVDVKYSGNDKITERWTKDPGQIKNLPKNFEKSKYYRTICEAIRVAKEVIIDESSNYYV
ncbi:hypothetical protein [Allofrancisella frigidaquae]|uniref:Uncharacterized protein n=1 Tax=Allofrancisella frigidaquae TaxID=1085644 RepID=A0A6M3HUS6_9GAMM|nr:hypothetical protein [Allofrancisella frigidaquae]QIV94877.1 hypothetical protein E3E15_05755 [Allofrancisella frigidaquae]